MAESWQERFAAFKGKSEEEIRAHVNGLGGYQVMLTQVLTGLAASIDPKRAPDTTLSYRLADGDDRYEYSIVIDETSARLESGADAGARITYGLAAADFVRMLAGEIDGATLYQAGRVKIDGDLGYVMQVQGLFGSRR